ncbi:MAG: type IV pilus modification PilV family protein [Halothiobacillaceae bacterium]
MTHKYATTGGRSRGFTLIEALIGLVVMSVGLLAIASLQSELISSSGQAKARSEALQLAEQDIENLRGYISRAQFDAITSLSDQTVTGTNTTFTLDRTVSSVGSTLWDVVVTVGWTDPKDGAQQVTLESLIGWSNPTSGARTALGPESGITVDRPTGRAIQGGRVYEAVPEGATANITTLEDGTEVENGTYTFTAPDGATELIDSDGRVLLTIRSGEAFSTISGRFYTTENINGADTFITASDASACLRLGIDPMATLPATGPTKYRYFHYTCYVGPAWYGNVGVTRAAGAHNNDRICVGEPDQPVDTSRMDSEHPALSTVRIYRGFVDRGLDHPDSVGIGIDPDTETYTAQNYDGHHFLLHRFGGNPTDADCNAELKLVSPSPFVDSPGKGFCLTPDYCPPVFDPGETLETTVAVEVTPQGFQNKNDFLNNGLETPPMDLDGNACTLTSSAATIEYTCTATRTGWTGTAWSGTLSIYPKTGVTVCDPLADAGPYPTQTTLAGNSVTFTDIPEDATELQIGVNIGKTAADCP